MPTILLVDDDRELAAMLGEYLSSEGFTVALAHDGKQGIEKASELSPDALVLDVMMPELDGFGVLQALRKFSQVPVLMLTAKGDDIDRIIGLEMGADDYLPKPCNPRELVARLKAILRRTQHQNSSATSFMAGDLEILPASRQAILNNQPISLTSSEYNLLEVLARQVGHVVDKETLSEQALGKPLTAYDRSIDMHMSKLRQKLGDDEQRIIQTVRGVGYQLTG
ncbi:MAG: Copper-sensing two-component system response regulator CpxR [uncultured Thiotrichaceae bacterium]|uniref:Copper-sensing two-component system response regulator CpxR n=1 Tax=uncultured Thiotrichaceae bacterium TaxID=298394 RepID=A0A6S6S9S7_9GAMM|nr:MAG: Copper-sensing two-component system response regulator CpxR [uncultured Thiotrichaceae bacterium]